MAPPLFSQPSSLPTLSSRRAYATRMFTWLVRVKEKRTNHRNWLRSSTTLVIVTGILATLPVVIAGFSLLSHDGFFHLHWHTGFSQQISAGNIYPRWIEQVNGGLGSPALFFYPPLPYYTTLCFTWLAPVDPSGAHRLGLTAMCMMIFSGLTARAWLRRFLGEREAVLGSLLYMLLPFHLAIDLWVRGALGQFCAYAWLPLILTAVHGIVNRNTFAAPGLAMAYTALILTNIPTTLMFSPVPVLYAVAIAPRKEKVRSAILVLLAMVMGIAMASGYLYPALIHRKHVNMAALTEGVFDYHNNFLFTAETLLSLRYKGQITWMVLPFAVAILLAWRAERRESNRSERFTPLNFWRCTVLASLFMMTPLSASVWEFIPPLRLVQFPMRFTAIYTLSLAACLPPILRRQGRLMKRRGQRTLKGTLLVAGILSLVLSCKFGVAHYAQALQHRTRASTQKELARAIDAHEYRTVWSPTVVNGGTDTLKALIERIEREGRRASIMKGEGTILDVRKTEGKIVLRTSALTPLTIQLPRFYYPGWRVETDSGTATICPSVGYGLLQITIPRGERTVRMRFGLSQGEKRGYFVSLIALVMVGFWGLYGRRWRRKIVESW